MVIGLMESHFIIPQQTQFKNLIFAIWQVRGNPAYKKETIMPKGVVDIIFNFSESSIIEARIDNLQIKLPKCFINGYNTEPIVMYIPGYQYFFGIRLNPVIIQSLFGIRPGELANKSFDLSLVNNKAIEILWQRLATLKSFEQRVGFFIHWLTKRNFNIDARDEAIRDFLFCNNETEVTVGSVSKYLMLSSRQLSRKLTMLTGMNTEEVLLYKKYLQSMRMIHERNSSLTEIAYACNFFDQSHFIRTFKSFTKMTPGEYRKIESPLPGHFFQ